jgi:hypothetical protein
VLVRELPWPSQGDRFSVAPNLLVLPIAEFARLNRFSLVTGLVLALKLSLLKILDLLDRASSRVI